MATPKKKTSPSRMKMRRSHIHLAECSYSMCENCGTPKLSHHICKKCGFYRGRQILVGANDSVE